MRGVNVVGTLKDKIYLRSRNQLKCENHSFDSKNRIYLKIGGGCIIKNHFCFSGVNNKITIAEDVQISNVIFEIIGENNEIKIGRGVILRDSVIYVGDKRSRLIVKNNVDVGVGAKWSVLEGTKVEIGEGCMFSTNSHILSSDAHSIISMSTNIRDNKANNILIGERVWFGEDVTCLKGAKIGSDTVFGCRSLILEGSYDKNAVYAGAPCKKLRENIYWQVKRI